MSFQVSSAWYDWGVILLELPGGAPLYAFSVLIGLGAALGLGWAVWFAPEDQRLTCLEAGLWSLVGALVGARAVYVALHWEYFRTSQIEILQFYRGGLSWPGALAGGLLALMLYSAVRQINPGEVADWLTPLLATAAIGAWLGCWLDGCAYGLPVASGGIFSARDEWGQFADRLPWQPLAALLTLAWFWGVERIKGRVEPGVAAALAFLGLALVLLGAAFLRADPIQQWRGLRLDAWAALLIALLAILVLAVFLTAQYRKQRRRGNHS
jgi:phosphatidylglycerol---prolipoprotein diacylglyceryl transferase